MIDKELILKPKITLFKVILSPFLVSMIVTLGISLFGYHGRNRKPFPSIATTLDLPIPIIAVLILIFFFALYLLYIYLPRVAEVANGELISINDKAVIIYYTDSKKEFKIKKMQRSSVKISNIWSKLYFYRYYRVGVIEFEYDRNKFSYSFPVRNGSLERNIENLSVILLG
jgi:hypothetical protein